MTLFPFGTAQRAAVFANYREFGTYSLIGGSVGFVALSQPSAPGFGDDVGDPVAVTQPNGTVHIGALARSATRGSLLVLALNGRCELG